MSGKVTPIRLEPDGTEHSATALARMFNVSQSVISKAVKNGKTTWTRTELEEWARTIDSGNRRSRIKITTHSGPPRNIDDVEYFPTLEERMMSRLRT